MKRIAVLSMIALMLALGVAPPAAFSQSLDAVIGQVTKIDPTTDKIAIKRGPIKKFGMDEGMTMVFHVRDPGSLKKVKLGDKVRFVPDRVNGQFTIMQIEKIKVRRSIFAARADFWAPGPPTLQCTAGASRNGERSPKPWAANCLR